MTGRSTDDRYAPPFEPPCYRGLTILVSPPHPLDKPNNVPQRPELPRSDSQRTTQLSQLQTPPVDFPDSRERSETMSTSSSSYVSSGTTEATSPSIGDWKEPLPPLSPITPDPADLVSDDAASSDSQDVQMHPCESKRISLTASPGTEDRPLPGAEAEHPAVIIDSSESSSEESEEDPRQSCVLLNALFAQDVVELTKHNSPGRARFRQARLPQQINLRNLNVQQIKYATISDVILYAKNGLGEGVLKIAEQ